MKPEQKVTPSGEQPKFTRGAFRVVGNELQYTDEGDLYAVIQTQRAAIDIIAPKIMADEHMANARLFAASHALYEAAKEALRYIKLEPVLDDDGIAVLAALRAALALVDGSQHQETKK